jgi:serine/threonine-protein kinase
VRHVLGLVTGNEADRTAVLDALFAQRQRAVLRQRIYDLQIRAEAAVFCGNLPLALDVIETADTLRLYDETWTMLCPLLEPLRGEPRFTSVRSRVAARAAAIRDAYVAEL